MSWLQGAFFSGSSSDSFQEKAKEPKLIYITQLFVYFSGKSKELVLVCSIMFQISSLHNLV